MFSISEMDSRLCKKFYKSWYLNKNANLRYYILIMFSGNEIKLNSFENIFRLSHNYVVYEIIKTY